MHRSAEIRDPLIRSLVNEHPGRISSDALQRIRAATEASVQRQAELDRLIAEVNSELQKRKHLEALQIEIETSEGAACTLAAIKNAVCKFYDVRQHDLFSSRRTSELNLPRHVAYYLARELTRFSFPVIGKHLGGRDHTTVLHGCRKISKLVKTDKQLAAQINTLTARLSQKEAA